MDQNHFIGAAFSEVFACESGHHLAPTGTDEHLPPPRIDVTRWHTGLPSATLLGPMSGTAQTTEEDDERATLAVGGPRVAAARAVFAARAASAAAHDQLQQQPQRPQQQQQPQQQQRSAAATLEPRKLLDRLDGHHHALTIGLIRPQPVRAQPAPQSCATPPLLSKRARIGPHDDDDCERGGGVDDVCMVQRGSPAGVADGGGLTRRPAEGESEVYVELSESPRSPGANLHRTDHRTDDGGGLAQSPAEGEGEGEGEEYFEIAEPPRRESASTGCTDVADVGVAPSRGGEWAAGGKPLTRLGMVGGGSGARRRQR